MKTLFALILFPAAIGAAAGIALVFGAIVVVCASRLLGWA